MEKEDIILQKEMSSLGISVMVGGMENQYPLRAELGTTWITQMFFVFTQVLHFTNCAFKYSPIILDIYQNPLHCKGILVFLEKVGAYFGKRYNEF